MIASLVGMVGWCVFVMDCIAEFKRMYRTEYRRKLGQ
jgi:hypothetical protein